MEYTVNKLAKLSGVSTRTLRYYDQIELLIQNVTKTIGSLQGGTVMQDKEKFKGFKQQMIDDNEKAYGEEVRKKYGDTLMKASNQKIQGMSQEDWDKTQVLSEKINKTLSKAIEQGDPSSDLAQKACDLHRQWLCMYWKDGMYSKKIHKSLVEGYMEDERFIAYYDKIAAGATEFLLKAITVYCK